MGRIKLKPLKHPPATPVAAPSGPAILLQKRAGDLNQRIAEIGEMVLAVMEIVGVEAVNARLIERQRIQRELVKPPADPAAKKGKGKR